jgi:hypothetical protein
MGTDIHGLIKVPTSIDIVEGKQVGRNYILYKLPRFILSRDYNFFSFLSDVRHALNGATMAKKYGVIGIEADDYIIRKHDYNDYYGVICDDTQMFHDYVNNLHTITSQSKNSLYEDSGVMYWLGDHNHNTFTLAQLKESRDDVFYQKFPNTAYVLAPIIEAYDFGSIDYVAHSYSDFED